MRQQQDRPALRITAAPSIEQAVVTDGLALKRGVNSRIALYEQIMEV
jgi:hypothetical protein